jgi:hypothetical protein
MMVVGHVAAAWRYRIKAMQGEVNRPGNPETQFREKLESRPPPFAR